MKEEMQGFHMTPNFKIFISEITLLNHLYTFNWIYPRIGLTLEHVSLRSPFVRPLSDMATALATGQ